MENISGIMDKATKTMESCSKHETLRDYFKRWKFSERTGQNF